MKFSRAIQTLGIGVLLTAGAAGAQAQQPAPAARSEAVAALSRCTAIAAPTERLSCFDAAAAAFQVAEQSGEIMVIDRGRMAMAQRQAFGTDEAPFEILQPAARRPDRIDSIETTLTRASQSSDGGWVFRLEDGSVWDQVGHDTVTFRNRAGEPVRVRRAALGSFLLVVGRSAAVRVRRQ